MTARRPDFFIVGAPKSGTTAMYTYLRAHDDLYLPERKELRYFGRDLEIRDRRDLSEGEYLAYFAGARRDQLVGTAYVWYLYSRLAAAEIADFAPNAKIIVMLRNPIDMLHALHGEHLSNGNEDIRDFDSALAAERDRREGRRIPAHAHLPQGLLYSQVPQYAAQLQRYFTVFGRDAVHVILYDDFAADTPSAYAGVLRFLGVRDDIGPDGFEVVNAAKRTRSEWLRHFLARPPDAPRRLVRAVVPRLARRALYRQAQRLNVARTARPPMTAETRRRLTRDFTDEITRLGALLQRDLRSWTEAGDTAQTPEGSARSQTSRS